MFHTHGEPLQRGSKRFIRCSLTVNPGTLELGITDFKHAPKLTIVRPRRNTEEVKFELFERQMQQSRPDFMDPFLKTIFKQPVKAEDGRTYEREYIEKWIAQAAAAGKPLLSPLLQTEAGEPLEMGPTLTPDTELAEAIAAARSEYKMHMAKTPRRARRRLR